MFLSLKHMTEPFRNPLCFYHKLFEYPYDVSTTLHEVPNAGAIQCRINPPTPRYVKIVSRTTVRLQANPLFQGDIFHVHIVVVLIHLVDAIKTRAPFHLRSRFILDFVEEPYFSISRLSSFGFQLPL